MATGTKTRFSISISPALASELDGLVARCGFPSRSQAVSELIRERLAERQADAPQAVIVGTITLMYDHHKRNLNADLTEIQHDYHELIRSVLHVHVDHCLCMEVLAVCGPSARVREMADRLIATKGVQSGKLAVSSVAKSAPHP
jgi:CopG family nickel-responsive transcriptional regulator